MKEELEKELDKWMEDYKNEERELLEKYPLKDNLSNRHPINELAKKYWEKKIEIYKKYGIQ